ncbi:Retrovirus-related Pol polyprotein from transposon TNT 1-94 [Eumeta japonica]|uniref:Retrovirus-related Pol polyprotein from transposon TNT 1-94 n=1 Tax=Eumeta variegata TaxID=151549 RepID=A0A4C1UBU3_EUMVA|nr:Retrovirus-related Pol polyprotein from transposon TNT 1-94 [Eumeta japonica]
MNRTIIEKAKCMINDAMMDKKFWAEACNTAVYLHNRTVSYVLNGKTPYKLWTGVKPNLSNLRIFGSPVMVQVNKEKRSKRDKKSTECILIGFPKNMKACRVFDPVKRIITTSRDVIVMEKESIMIQVAPEGKDQESVNDGMPQLSPNLQDSVGDDRDSTLTKVLEDDFLSDYMPSEYKNSVETMDDNYRITPTRERRAPNRYGFDGICYSENVMVCGV